MNKQFILGTILATVLTFFGAVWLLTASDNKEQEKVNKPLLGEAIMIQGADHVKGKEHEPYNTNPPTSGPMWNSTAGPGIKTENVADESIVHSMEHGAVVVWYQADLPKGDIEKITQAFSAVPGKKIMIPRQNLDTPVTLTSWGRLLKLEAIDEGKIKEFIATNENRAPEKAAI